MTFIYITLTNAANDTLELTLIWHSSTTAGGKITSRGRINSCSFNEMQLMTRATRNKLRGELYMRVETEVDIRRRPCKLVRSCSYLIMTCSFRDFPELLIAGMRLLFHWVLRTISTGIYHRKGTRILSSTLYHILCQHTWLHLPSFPTTPLMPRTTLGLQYVNQLREVPRYQWYLLQLSQEEWNDRTTKSPPSQGCQRQHAPLGLPAPPRHHQL